MQGPVKDAPKKFRDGRSEPHNTQTIDARQQRVPYFALYTLNITAAEKI